MAYSTDHLRTAGKITVFTSLIGIFVFFLAFITNLGVTEVTTVGAENASTTVTVLNTPPVWTASTTEEFESSQTLPTNAGSEVSWVAVGTDSNSEDYYLLICGTSNTPSSTSGGAPHCNGGTQWAVSTATISGTQARAATTTLDGWGESNAWYAWVCDGNVGSPRCSTLYTQGVNATNTSPFEVNHRPLFSAFWDNSPAVPGTMVTFTSTSSDTDSSGTQDYVKLFVCATSGFNTSTDSCTGTTLASTTVFTQTNATATYTIVVPTQDQDYSAYGYIIDSHGFESAGVSQNTDSTLSVSNAAPTVDASTVSLVQPVTTDIVLINEAAETTGFTLSFTTLDNNSCDAAGGGAADEITGYELSIYRNGSGLVTSSSSTCPVTGPYDPNNCYPSSVPTATWNLVCTPDTGTCLGGSDVDMEWDCTFPLWYVADPTDGTATSTQYSTNDWRAQVRALDDGQEHNLVSLTGPESQSASGVDVKSLLAFALNTLSIPYGSLEPGQKNTFLTATTTVASTGNVGLDKDVTGQSMCTTYTNANPCPTSATSTIPESEQVFGTSTIPYDDAVLAGSTLSSTTAKEIEINVPKSTATSSQAIANAFWGIQVPATITFAGDYKGENTFTARVGESSNW